MYNELVFAKSRLTLVEVREKYCGRVKDEWVKLSRIWLFVYYLLQLVFAAIVLLVMYLPQLFILKYSN